MCELGATDADLAKAFGVDQSVIGLWKVTYKEFSESSRLGAGCADERVEQSLHQRAAGYEYVARKVTSHKGQSAIVEYPVHVPADVAAGKYWLLNRQSSRWKDQSKIEPDPNEDSPLMGVARMLSGTGLKPKE